MLSLCYPPEEILYRNFKVITYPVKGVYRYINISGFYPPYMNVRILVKFFLRDPRRYAQFSYPESELNKKPLFFCLQFSCHALFPLSVVV